MTRAIWILAMAALFVSVACSDQPTNAGSERTLTLRLTTPHPDDGALTFQLSGPVIDSVSAANGSLQLFTRRVDGATIVGAVVGPLADGAIVTLHVPDVGAAAGYTATVLEVADRADAVRASLAGYALNVIR